MLKQLRIVIKNDELISPPGRRIYYFKFWRAWRDSNSRRRDLESPVLPTELQARGALSETRTRDLEI